ncbi:hypothetical protein LZ30DRAFT_268077 [Colletotrichum cereale]|nr:hypothetical protein LZ30DRAFT_268077 [Colletotrichum cereale]
MLDCLSCVLGRVGISVCVCACTLYSASIAFATPRGGETPLPRSFTLYSFSPLLPWLSSPDMPPPPAVAKKKRTPRALALLGASYHPREQTAQATAARRLLLRAVSANTLFAPPNDSWARGRPPMRAPRPWWDSMIGFVSKNPPPKEQTLEDKVLAGLVLAASSWVLPRGMCALPVLPF